PEALAATDALLRSVPENRDVLLLRAMAQRQLGDAPAALATLARLEGLQPRLGTLFQERGDCHVALRQPPEALAAFQRAVACNPALLHSWSMLEGMHQLAGDGAGAAAARAQIEALRSMPPEVVAASGLLADGEVTAAEELLRSFLLRHGLHAEALRLLARVAVARDRMADAQQLCEAALRHAPDFQAARFDYIHILLERYRYPQALREAERLVAVNPGNRDCLTLEALCRVGLGQHERALARYRELLPGAARPAELHLAIGHVLNALGRGGEAVAAYQAAAAARPTYGDAYWSLANLKPYRFDEAELERMLAAAGAATDPDRYQLCFALGKALEDRARYAESFAHYERGNALRRAAGHHDPERLERQLRAQMQVCTAELFAQHRGVGAPDADPIFIVGLPRSGSTLVEQILASHPAVEGTHELAEIPRLASEIEEAAGTPSYPALLRQLSGADCARLGAEYLAATRAYRGRRPHFIDKMPNNFRHLGLIQLILPNARIIDVRREPMACCFGIFKQLFARGQEFAYGLEDIARYYRGYLELMRHWDAVLPGRVLRVQYEDLVGDLEGTVRRLLEHCGLGFEPACVEFHRSSRSVGTASAQQVRQPLYREALGHWRHYEPWLGALRAALGDALTRYRD
ncbi:MAG TPA: sulfotransferase, partial [Steroidobacteraceae bacterium]|nr:sulfotransferase [Steroidobacteraceae bacterium]